MNPLPVVPEKIVPSGKIPVLPPDVQLTKISIAPISNENNDISSIKEISEIPQEKQMINPAPSETQIRIEEKESVLIKVPELTQSSPAPLNQIIQSTINLRDKKPQEIHKYMKKRKNIENEIEKPSTELLPPPPTISTNEQQQPPQKESISTQTTSVPVAPTPPQKPILSDQMKQEMIQKIDTNIKLIIQGQHPEFLVGLDNIKRQKEERITSTNMFYDLEKLKIDHRQKSEIENISNDYFNQIELLKASLLNHLLREKKTLCKQSIIPSTKNPRKRKRGHEKARLLFEGYSKKQKVTKNDVFKGFENISHLSQDEIDEDLKFLGLKKQ